MTVAFQLENKIPSTSMNHAFGFSGQNDGNGSSNDGCRARASIISLLQAAGTSTNAAGDTPLVVTHSGNTTSTIPGATRSSLTDTEKLLLAASQGTPQQQRQNQLGNPGLPSPFLGGIAVTRQAMIERVKQQEQELDFLRAQFGLSAASASPRLDSMRGLGRNQPFVVPPSLRSPALAATPAPKTNALNILSCAAPVPAHFNSSTPTEDPAPAPVDTSKGTFPMKLHQMLSTLEQQPGGTDIASFLHHGNSFAIHKPREFLRHVMPQHFRMSRFSSFQRQLNLYDFVRITSGVDRGAYTHPQFVYGKPELTVDMKRIKIKGVKNRKARLLEEEAAKNKEANESSADATIVIVAKKDDSGTTPDGQTDTAV